MILITLIMKKAKNILKGLLALAIVFLFTQCTENKNTTPAPAAPAAGGSVEGMKIAYVEIDSLLTKYRFWNDLNELMIQKEENIRTTLNEKAKALDAAMRDFQRKYENNGFVSQESALKGEEANFQTGLDALAKIAKTYLSISVNQKAAALTQAKNVTLTVFDGPHPAGNVGVQINNIAPINKGETVWTIDPQAVIFIGRLFNTGHVDLTRLVAVTGSEVKKPSYCKLKVGALLTNVFAGNVSTDKNLRYISGNALTGKQITANGFLGAFHSQVTVIPEGDDVHEMLGWIMPRFDQFSTSHSYFSWLMGKKEYTLDARVKGGERHMIMSNEYDRVLPMDIMPEYLIKAIIAGDIDRMEALGIYEVAPEDFALCEFVCSSKMELQRIVREGLDMLRREMC